VTDSLARSGTMETRVAAAAFDRGRDCMRTAASRTGPHHLLTLTAGLVLTLGVALGVVVGTATDAHAHTRLESTDPPDGSTLTGPLTAVTLTFGGAVRVGEVRVTGPSGVSAATGAASVGGAVVTQPVTLVEDGLHTVEYAVTADDGHRLAGSVTFAYNVPTTAPVATTPPTTSSAAGGSPPPPNAEASPVAGPNEAATSEPARTPASQPAVASHRSRGTPGLRRGPHRRPPTTAGPPLIHGTLAGEAAAALRPVFAVPAGPAGAARARPPLAPEGEDGDTCRDHRAPGPSGEQRGHPPAPG
jgi:methionine-rich copper-binding protein CopC